MQKNGPELLAPAGNFDCLLAAINAGADAIYLGGDLFGARAYADNFNQEQLIRAIYKSHLYGVKIYLTVNTLVKEKEINELCDYLRPFYDVGLDGVIVQDFGVFYIIRENFPDLELHASTQMTVTGSESAAFLKKQGACRIVPARELQLSEICSIKEHVDIEIESFIHGAMCYCYSGQCLFSSMLGERSGNRGRCAGPCRLPYQTKSQTKEEQYPLSLKDMCTIEDIPKLIEAGIDSFKIEGRMKSPEYVGGVTFVYRKYIDYYKGLKEKGKENEYKVTNKDKEFLSQLYIRSKTKEGYYFEYHGRDMITIDKPCYNETPDAILQKLNSNFVHDTPKLQLKGFIYIQESKPLKFILKYKEETVEVEGPIVQSATNRPIDEQGVAKQIKKMGNTDFELENLTIDIKGNCFVPVQILNEIRRSAITSMQEQLIKKKGLGRK